MFKLYSDKYTKIIICLLGLILVASIVFLVTPHRSTTSSNNGTFDFYARFNNENPIDPNYILSRAGDRATKIKITSLPNHTDLKLNGNKLNIGDEVMIADIDKLSLYPNIDEYDNFSWSSLDGSKLLNTISTKFGVGSLTFPPTFTNFTKTDISNTVIAINLTDLTSNISFVNNYNNGAIVNFYSITIRELPANGTLRYNGIDVVLNQIILLSTFTNIDFIPSPNYIGTNTFRFDFTEQGIGNPNYFPSDFFITGLNAIVTLNSTNQAPVTTPQTQSIVSLGSAIFPPFTATDPENSSTTFTRSVFPTGFICTETAPGLVGNIITCTPTSSVTSGIYSFTVTPFDALGLAGTPVTYTITYTQSTPVEIPTPTEVKPTPILLLRTGGA